MMNDLIGALNRKQQSAVLFVDLTKAFDSVDHALLLTKLRIVGFGYEAIEDLFCVLMHKATNLNPLTSSKVSPRALY